VNHRPLHPRQVGGPPPLLAGEEPLYHQKKVIGVRPRAAFDSWRIDWIDAEESGLAPASVGLLGIGGGALSSSGPTEFSGILYNLPFALAYGYPLGARQLYENVVSPVIELELNAGDSPLAVLDNAVTTGRGRIPRA